MGGVLELVYVQSICGLVPGEKKETIGWLVRGKEGKSVKAPQGRMEAWDANEF